VGAGLRTPVISGFCNRQREWVLLIGVVCPEERQRGRLKWATGSLVERLLGFC
jgi:hypothetical protein